MSHQASSAPAMRRAVYQIVEEAERAKLDAYQAVDYAHVLMLHECGIVPRPVASALLAGLRRAYARLALEPTPAGEQQSLLFAVEELLRQDVGDAVAGYLQTGRSRLDQSEAVRRLQQRTLLLAVCGRFVPLLAAFHQRAGDWSDVLTAGWTHLQHSQPWNMGHYMLALFDRGCRDLERVLQCLDRTDLSALGGAAMAGTDWPIDRERVASLLGHPGTVANALDASTQHGDYPAEAAAVLSILAANLARWAADFHLWSSSEFGLMRLADAHCGTSSIMPQKRNPIALAPIRALAGQSVGWLPAQLAIAKSPASSDCDGFYVSASATASLHELVDVLELATDVVRHAELDRTRCEQALEGSWSTMSAVADTLVRKCGMDFRTAHAIVATLARALRQEGRNPDSVQSSDLAEAARAASGREVTLSDGELRRALSPRSFARSRTSAGGTAPSQVQALLERSAAALAGWTNEVARRQQHADRAARDMQHAVVTLAEER